MSVWKLFNTALILLFLFSCAWASGQADYVGARPLGMGGAFTAVADNPDAAFWNPAGLSNIASQEITTMQTRLSTDADQYYISYAAKLFKGTLGISWSQISLGSISQTTTTDAFNEVITTNVFSYFSNSFMFSYGMLLNPGVSLGLTAKYLTSDMSQITGGQSYGYSLTPGVLIKPSGFFSLGFKVDDLFNEQKWGTGALEKSNPKARIGAALKKSESLFAVDVAQSLAAVYSPELSLGYEWRRDKISLRLGILDSAITAGTGFSAGNASLDYAYVQQAALSRDNVHRISLSGKW